MTCNTSSVQVDFKRRRPIQSTQFYISMIEGAYLGKAELLVTLEMLFGTCCFCLIPQFFSWWNQSRLATLRCSPLLYIQYVYNMTHTASINWWRDYNPAWMAMYVYTSPCKIASIFSYNIIYKIPAKQLLTKPDSIHNCFDKSRGFWYKNWIHEAH